MAGLTLQELQARGAKPVSTGLTLDQLKAANATPVSPTPTPQPSLLDRVTSVLGKIFPGQELGKAVGASIYNLGKTGSQLLHGDLAGAQKTAAAGAAETNASFGKVVGDTASAAALPVTMAVGGGGVLSQAARYGALGAVSAGGNSLAQGNDLESAAKDAAKGGALSALVPVAGKALSAAGRAISDTLPKRLMQSAIGQTKAELLAGKDVSAYALKKWKIGSADSLIKGSTEAIDALDQQIQHNIANVAPKTARILKNEIVSDVVDQINAAGGAIDAKEVGGILNSLAPQSRALLQRGSLSLPEANALRRSLDKTIGDRGFLVSQLPFNKEVLKAFDDVLRERVKTLAPKGTRELFSEMSKEITLRDAVQSRYAGQAANQVLNAFDVILAGTGFLGGGPAGSVATVVGKKIVQSPTFKTGGAVALDQLKNAAPIFRQAGKIAKPASVAGLSRILPGSRDR